MVPASNKEDKQSPVISGERVASSGSKPAARAQPVSMLPGFSGFGGGDCTDQTTAPRLPSTAPRAVLTAVDIASHPSGRSSHARALAQQQQSHGDPPSVGSSESTGCADFSSPCESPDNIFDERGQRLTGKPPPNNVENIKTYGKGHVGEALCVCGIKNVTRIKIEGVEELNQMHQVLEEEFRQDPSKRKAVKKYMMDTHSVEVADDSSPESLDVAGWWVAGIFFPF